MSDRTRNFLWLYGLSLAITLAALAGGALIFLLFNGSIPVPAVTVNNFWSLTNTLLLPSFFGWIAFKLEQHRRQSQRNEQKIETAQQKLDQIDHTLKNGGGQGMQQIQATVNQLLHQAQPRDPQTRTRADDTSGDEQHG